MSERAKTSRPQRTRAARDPRVDSLPPAVDDEAPLKAKPLRSGADPLQARVALLEAEVESLKAARAADSDDLAQMLIRVAEAERLREAAEQRARDAEASSVAQGEALLARVAEAEQKRAAAEKKFELAEAEHASGQQALFDQLVNAQRALDAAEQRAPARVSTVDARAAMARVESWLEELERGETMAQALRVWMIQQARLVARTAAAAPGVDVTPAAPPSGGDTVALDDADVEPLE